MLSSLLSNQDFIKLWAGQTVSLFGSLISRLALPFLVIYLMHASAYQVALLRVCELTPGILVGLLAGVWVDRQRRRQVMVISDVCRALLVVSVPIFLAIRHLTWAQILLVAVVVSVLNVTFDSAYGAYLPTLVDKGQITDANGKLAASGAVSEVAGFGLAGALFEWLGAAWTLSIDAASFVFSALAVLLIRRREPRLGVGETGQGGLSEELSQDLHDERPQGLRYELSQGLSYVWGNRTLSMLLGVAGIQNLFYGISGTVFMLYMSRGLNVPPGIQGVLYATGGIGALVASALVSRLFARFKFGVVFVVVSFLGAVGALLVPLAYGPVWLIVLFVLGQQLLGDGADTIFEVGLAAFVQGETDNRILGRVNSIWLVGTSICLLIGTLMGGSLATWVGLRDTFFIAVSIRFIGTVVAALSPIRKVVQVVEPSET